MNLQSLINNNPDIVLIVAASVVATVLISWAIKVFIFGLLIPDAAAKKFLYRVADLYAKSENVAIWFALPFLALGIYGVAMFVTAFQISFVPLTIGVLCILLAIWWFSELKKSIAKKRAAKAKVVSTEPPAAAS